MLTKCSQLLTHSSFFYDWLQFKNNLSNVKKIQHLKLQEILSHHPQISDIHLFKKISPCDFSDQQDHLKLRQESVIRYQPTSGSGAKEKLIPYTSGFIKELNKALNPWLFDTMKSHPRILGGKHYWSLSWLPTHYRERGWELDDFELLPAWKKNLTRKLLAVPHEVARASTLSASQFATLSYLIATEDLTFISVWSPTFMLQLLELKKIWKEALIETLKKGKWATYVSELSHLMAPFNPKQAERLKELDDAELWPKLKLISSWDSSSSAGWAKKLQERFPNADFQGKGLWATEGVVTIPFEGKFVLSYMSHFYEFLDLKTGEIRESHELKEGMEVHPIITAGNGFIRYHLKDRLVVNGFLKSAPTFEFLERDSSFDMVGEKIHSHTFFDLHKTLQSQFPHLIWVVAFAVHENHSKPYYCFVFEGVSDNNLPSVISEFLHEHFHYHLARELGQLGEERIFVAKDGFTRYENFQMKRGMVQGNIKVELASHLKSSFEIETYRKYFS